MKWLRNATVNRTSLILVAMVLQIIFLVLVLKIFVESFYLMYTLSLLVSAAVVLWILSDSSKAAYKLAWIIPIMLSPVFGGFFYLFFGRVRLRQGFRAKMMENSSIGTHGERVRTSVDAMLEELSPLASRQSVYLSSFVGNPLYTDTKASYFPTGESVFEQILVELEKAERFIYIEFFIIAEGLMWGKILEILVHKAKLGVDVRVMYDDFGCMTRLPRGYERHLESLGIRCTVFNPIRPILSLDINHRDHRKLLIIDGKVGFTGGINLADEYINVKKRFGYWKDNALMIEGQAVDSMTTIFLRLWNNSAKGAPEERIQISYEMDRIEGGTPSKTKRGMGFVQPFEDSPVDDEPVGENVYLNLIGAACRYLYITTPYLILDSEMATALTLAAKGGVDVRIITPHIPDKWFVHNVTRSNYRALLKAGARIFEYSPGFIHSKTFVADDLYGVLGTINLDFRSLYLHFECGIWLYDCAAIQAMKKDILETQEVCVEITARQLDDEPFLRKATTGFLRLFAPLM
jgi:cardiolipin synthase